MKYGVRLFAIWPSAICRTCITPCGKSPSAWVWKSKTLLQSNSGNITARIENEILNRAVPDLCFANRVCDNRSCMGLRQRARELIGNRISIVLHLSAIDFRCAIHKLRITSSHLPHARTPSIPRVSNLRDASPPRTASNLRLGLRGQPYPRTGIAAARGGTRSGSVRYAARKDFFRRYVRSCRCTRAGKLSATEAYTRSMSWGLMQVMGQVARECGFEETSSRNSAIQPPESNGDAGSLSNADSRWSPYGDVEAALLAWNGGANPDYPSEVLARTRNYSSRRS